MIVCSICLVTSFTPFWFLLNDTYFIQIDMLPFTVQTDDDALLNQSEAAALQHRQPAQTHRTAIAVRPTKPRHRLRTQSHCRLRNNVSNVRNSASSCSTSAATIMHSVTHIVITVTLMLFLLLRLCDAMPGSSTNFKISPKPCVGNSYSGTCMFVWECIKSEGQHVGMCMDSFMFGSCCAHNLTDNIVMPQHIDYRPTKPLVTHHHGTKYKPSAAMTSHLSPRFVVVHFRS